MQIASPGRAPLLLTTLVVASIGALSFAQTNVESPPDEQATPSGSDDWNRRINENAPATVIEARGRARILHETLHGTLQVMHRDFFREDEELKIPSRSLEDVFSELAKSYGVNIHWIAVDLKAMNIDNEPTTDFEKDAVRVLKSGKAEFELVKDNHYHFAGRIRLSAICLSCHASRRANNDDRSAGLVMTMPLSKQDEGKRRDVPGRADY